MPSPRSCSPRRWTIRCRPAWVTTAWIGNAWNDRISSVRVPAGFKVQLFADINYGGRSVTLTADNANLVGAGFNDAASSMKITAPPAAA